MPPTFPTRRASDLALGNVTAIDPARDQGRCDPDLLDLAAGRMLRVARVIQGEERKLDARRARIETDDRLHAEACGSPGAAFGAARASSAAIAQDARRSEERSVGKECVSKCRSRGSPEH